jgi:hypothetical protein
MARKKKERNYIPVWKENDWNAVCRDCDAYWNKRKQKAAKKHNTAY